MAVDWTKEQIETLHARWLAGDSAPNIALLIGKSVNSVRGKAFRLGLPSNRCRRVARTNSAKRTVNAPVGNGEPVPLMDLRWHHCRSVIGRGADGLATYCGKPKIMVGEVRKAYCQEHYDKHYVQTRYVPVNA